MSLMESMVVPLGTLMPEFELKDPFGVAHASSSLPGRKGLLLVVTCNHCPYAKAVWPRLIRLAKYAEGLGIRTAAINPNIHPNYPEDAPEVMRERIKEWKIPFPYLIDETQEVASKLKAQCTPDIYLFDATGKLVYHGRIDDNWQDESRVTKEELKEAITCLASGRPLPEVQYPSMGCSIKWREPRC